MYAVGLDPAPTQRSLLREHSRKENKYLRFEVGDQKPVDHILVLDREAENHSHRFAVNAAELSSWVYNASNFTPDGGNAIMLENHTGKGVALKVTDSGEWLKLPAGEILRVDLPGSIANLQLQGSSVAQEISAGKWYDLRIGTGNDVSFEASEGLPAGFEIQAVHQSKEKNIAGWSVVTSSDTIWIVFQGTKNLADVVVDMALLTFDDAPHGLRVQGGMWLALNQRQCHTLNTITATITELQESNSRLQNVVMCGHSLGGAYAMLAGLDRLHKGLSLTSVIGFGAPQVIVPDRANPYWQKLSEITSVYVNSWDCVPRTPSCSGWLFNVVPAALPSIAALKIGGVSVGIKASSKVIEQFAPHKEIFSDYDMVGSLVFVRTGSRKVVVVPCTEGGDYRALLSKEPPKAGPFVLHDHMVSNYVSILRRLD
jgi:hypothetical protein